MIWAWIEVLRFEDAWLAFGWGIAHRDVCYTSVLAVADAEAF